MPESHHEKLDHTISFKVPDLAKQGYDGLTKEQKADLAHEVRLTIARHIHLAKFNPRDYLGDEA